MDTTTKTTNGIITVGGYYRVKKTSIRKCGNFNECNANEGATLIQITDIRSGASFSYNICNENKKKINSCSSCLRCIDLLNLDGTEVVQTKLKEEKGICILTGKLDKLVDIYNGVKVNFNVSLKAYEKLLSGNLKRKDDKPGVAIIDKEPGYIKSKRTFGVELECSTTTRESLEIADYLIHKNFRITNDGSINGSYTREYVSPPLSGQDGELALTETCAMLSSVKFKTDASCGTHVHIGVEEYMSEDEELNTRLKRLYEFYVVIDRSIASLIPKSRRQNRYCGSIQSSVDDSDLDKVKSGKKLFNFLYRTNNDVSPVDRDSSFISRYKGINFSSLYNRGTIEIRYHQGTLDAKKIIAWADFHAGIIDLVMSGTLTDEDIESLKKLKTAGGGILLRKLLVMVKPFVNHKTPKAMLDRYSKYKVVDDVQPIKDEEEDNEDDDWFSDEGDY